MLSSKKEREISFSYEQGVSPADLLMRGVLPRGNGFEVKNWQQKGNAAFIRLTDDTERVAIGKKGDMITITVYDKAVNGSAAVTVVGIDKNGIARVIE